MTNDEKLYRGTRVVWYVAYVLEALLAFRFILKLLSANQGAGFTELVYGVTAVPLAPFRYVFEADALGGSVFEWSTLLAMIVYWLLAWGIVRIIVMGRSIPTHEAHRGLEAQDVP